MNVFKSYKLEVLLPYNTEAAHSQNFQTQYMPKRTSHFTKLTDYIIYYVHNSVLLFNLFSKYKYNKMQKKYGTDSQNIQCNKEIYDTTKNLKPNDPYIKYMEFSMEIYNFQNGSCFWVMTMCRIRLNCQHFRNPYCVHLQCEVTTNWPLLTDTGSCQREILC